MGKGKGGGGGGAGQTEVLSEEQFVDDEIIVMK